MPSPSLPLAAPDLTKTAIVVVDPIGAQTGEQLPERVRQRGATPILVSSGNNAAGTDHIIHSGDPETTFRAVEAQAKRLGLTIIAIVPGNRSGATVADQLASRARLPGNSTALSGVRTDKVRMHQRLQEKNLAYAKSAYASSVDEITQFIIEKLDDFPDVPLVIKPARTSNEAHVFVLRDPEKIPDAFAEVIAAGDGFGKSVTQVALQEGLVGTEYLFSTVSTEVVRDGRLVGIRLALGAWRFHRHAAASPDRAPRVRSLEWVPFHDLPKPLAEYAFQVLGAMEITRGAAHLKIMMTADRPVLIDISPSLPDGLPGLILEAPGSEFDPIALTLDSYVNPERVARLADLHHGAYPPR